jgi:amino acid adenylation domain-containing protein
MKNHPTTAVAPIPSQSDAFWLERLRGAPHTVEWKLPSARARQSMHGETLYLSVGIDTTNALKTYAKEQRTTLFVVLLSALAGVLARFVENDEVVIGLPVVTTFGESPDAAVTCGVNVMPVRLALDSRHSGQQFVEATRAEFLRCYPHAHVSLERIAEITGARRSAFTTPLFQILFTSLSENPGSALILEGASLRTVQVTLPIAKFNLAVATQETSGGLDIAFEFATDLFANEHVESLAQSYAAYLSRMTDFPTSSAAVLAVAEGPLRQQLLDWNDGIPIQDEETLDGMLEMAARRWEGEPAVSMHGVTLSYGELRRRSQLLAWHLQQLGVQPSSRVGVSLGRDEHLVPALWAVLRCGAAYVPLDPSYPAQRLEFIRADAGVEVVLCPQARRGEFEAGGARCVAVDALDWTERREARTVAHRPQDLAYVLYTSGSTGQPKGVMLEHRNAVNLVKWAWSAFSRDELALTLASTSINFDLSVFEIFAPLTAGHAIWLVDNALATADYPEQGLTLINTVPSLAQALVRSGSIPSSVRVFTLCGEPLTRELADALYARGHIEKVYNLYGPTETTTYSTVSLVPRSEDAPVRIGKPLRGTQLYVLDEQGEPAPLGVAGELFIGGAGVARGYHRRDELTAERFVWRELPLVGRQRVYRTGDRVRWLANGELDFLGRIDQQIKLRGYRIELEEIEHHLRAQKGIASAVVGTETGDHGPMLVAYLQMRDSSAGSNVDEAVAAMHERLQATLPLHMVPSAYRLVDAMPLTPSGKLDRRALVGITGRSVAAERPRSAFVPPAGDVENALAGMWRDVLGAPEPISADANFFDIGGNSLLAMQLLFRLRRNYPVPLTLGDLFEASSIQKLAARLKA